MGKWAGVYVCLCSRYSTGMHETQSYFKKEERNPDDNSVYGPVVPEHVQLYSQ